MIFDGADITGLPAHQRVARGLALVPEGRKLFPELTVEENLLVAGGRARPGPWTLDAVLDAFPMLQPLRRQRAATLSGGEQQATAIARALMTNPRLLLIDEVSLGLSPQAVEIVYESLRALIRDGATVVLVEQDLSRALSVAGRVVCLLEGRVVLRGGHRRGHPRTGHRGLLRTHRVAARVGQDEAAMTVVNAVVQGMFLGGLYALFACGLSLMFGVMRIINLAHGDIAVLGAFGVWMVATQLGLSPFLALLLALPVMLALGYALQRTLLARSLRAGELTPLLTTFGLAIVHPERAAADLLPGRPLARVRPPAPVSIGSWRIADRLAVPVPRRAGARCSRWPCSAGCSSCCAAPRSAARCGPPPRIRTPPAWSACRRRRSTPGRPRSPSAPPPSPARSSRIHSSFAPSSGPTQLIFAFEAVVIGGLGSLWGTLVGGIVLGVAQTIGATIDPQYSILAGHIVFLVVLASPRGRFAARRGAGAPRHDHCGHSRGHDRAGWTVRRSSRASRIGSRRAGRAVAVALFAVPQVFGANIVQQLTTLLILVILAVDVERAGRLRRPGLGRAADIHRLRGVRHDLPHPARRGALPRGRAGRAGVAPRSRPRCRPLVLRLRGGQFAVGTWVVAEAIALLVMLDHGSAAAPASRCAA